MHGRDATEVHASDLTLDKFIDAATLTAAPTLPGPSAEVRTVLLTGATGFLGRYLALEWLEQMERVDGKLICLVRAESDEDARRRLDKTFDSGDPELLRHFQELAADHLEVIAGDKGEANLGLDQQTWQRLADTVDLIVDSAAVVNGVLPYSELFGPNVVGTAELIRFALTTKLKPYSYVSTADVGDQIEPSAFTEDADIRVISPTRTIDGSFANGYGNSKWAGEVLLREANDLCGLPVAVFRCDMIMADPTYAGQLNVSDTVTRMVLSLVATGVAPGSFYQLDADGNRQRAHFDGLPVEFVAEAIATLGAAVVDGFETYHVMNPHDDGIGLDEYVDWLIEAGYPIERIGDFGEWLQRFETGLRALPDRAAPALGAADVAVASHSEQFAAPEPTCGSFAPTDRFRAAVQEAKIGPDKDIRTSRTSRRRSSSNTSPTCNCSDCSNPLEELHSVHRRSWRNNMRRIALSIYWGFLTVVRSFSLVRQKDAAAYYTSLGDDVIDFMNEGYVDDSKPLWLNLGYWKEARTYPDACVAMVELLGTRGGLQPGDEVLDVGVGFAEQDFVLLDRFKVSRITGLDITPVHVDKGRERVAKRGLEKQIDIRLGSATAMEFPDASFDRVLALECAFHFDTRDQFVREAFRVLKPGGSISIADMLPVPGKKSSRATAFARRYGHIPEANLYDREEYSRRLSAVGFDDVLVESIRQDVFPGMANYSRQRIVGNKKMDEVVVEVSEDDRAQCRGVEIWERGTGLTDYVIASARKPLDT